MRDRGTAVKQVLIHPAALAEAETAERWYGERSESAATEFLAEIDRALSAITESPDRWPVYLASTRRFLLKRFPFAVVYRDLDSYIHIVAVAHGRRRPGYWKARAQ